MAKQGRRRVRRQQGRFGRFAGTPSELKQNPLGGTGGRPTVGWSKPYHERARDIRKGEFEHVIQNIFPTNPRKAAVAKALVEKLKGMHLEHEVVISTTTISILLMYEEHFKNCFFIRVLPEQKQFQKSVGYLSKSRAMMAFNLNKITWIERSELAPSSE